MSNTLKLLESTFSYIPTDKGLNFIVCGKFNETFLNVYELVIAGKHIIAECVDTIDNSPVIKLNIEYNNSAYDALFVLKEGEDNIIFNPATLRHGSKILQTEKSILEDIAADDIAITEDIVVEELEIVAKPDVKLDIERYKKDALRIIGENYIDKKSKIEDLKVSLVSLIEKNLSDIKSSSVTDINTIKTQLHESVIEQVNNYKIDTDASIAEINSIRENVLSTVDLYVDNIKQVVSEKTEDLTSLQESVIYSINEKIAELDIVTENHRKEVEAAFTGLTQLANNSSIQLTGMVGGIYEDVAKVKQSTIDGLNAELTSVTASVNSKLKDLQSTADKKISSISKLVESKISELQTEKDKTHIELVAAKNELVTSLQEAIKTFEIETTDKTAGLLEIKHQFLDQVKEQSDTINAVVNENKQEIQTLVTKITEAVEEKIKKINLVATKKEDLAQLKKQLEQRIDTESANIKKVLASYGGGGSVAAQYANGGTMNGSLNVNGQILSGGVDISTLFSGGGGGVSGDYLPLSGGTLTGNLNLNYNNLLLGGSSGLAWNQLSIQDGVAGASMQPNLVAIGQNEYSVNITSSEFTIGNSDSGKSAGLQLNTQQVASSVTYYTPAVGGALITDQSVWPNTNSIGWADAMFYRDGAADTIAQRRTTNPQTFRVYNTYITTSRYERGFAGWNSNVFQIGTEKSGVGLSARPMSFITDGVERINIGAAGGVTITGSISAPGPTLTGSQATNTLNVSANWNTTGNPTLIYGRVANTASGATANLIDVGTTAGGTLFRVGKDGGIILGGVQQVITSPSTYSKLIAANWLFANAANPGSQYFYAEPGQITISQANGSLATTLNSAAGATLQLGINAASGVNQTIKACNGTAGAGANLILVGGTGTTTNGGVVVGTNGTSSGLIRHGTATLVSGTVTVSDTNIVAGSRIFVNRQTDGGTIGDSYSITRIAGTSFTITSKTANATATLDTSIVSYLIINP